MIPKQEEYNKFGSSTKLLIHPKDIPDLQFDRKSRNKGEISPNTEILMIEVNITSGGDEYGKIPPNKRVNKTISSLSSDTQKLVECSGLLEGRGKLSPKAQNCTQNQMINLSKQYIVGAVEECAKQDTSGDNQLVDTDNKNTWFYSPINCVSKLSKALKQGVTNTMGLEQIHTASTAAGESEKLDFILFVALITVFFVTAWGVYNLGEREGRIS